VCSILLSIIIGGNVYCGAYTRPAVPVTSQTYPICFYDTELGAIDSARDAWPIYSQKLAQVVNSVAPSARSIAVDSRAMVVTASFSAHQRIRGIWPSVACYGQSANSLSGRLLDICTKYVTAYLVAEQRKRPLPADLAVPLCQTFSNPLYK